MANGQETMMIILACLAAQWTLEAKAAAVISDVGAVQYLAQFGYLPPIDPNLQAITSEEAFSKAISEFQSFGGINVTGNMDAETAYLMSLARCGNKDKVEKSAGRRSKRYAFMDTKWNVKNLTYKISKYDEGLDKATVDREIARALAVWSDYTDLTFTRKSGQVNIEISFEFGEHGDGQPFDGPRNTLAHAANPGPGIGSDVHFDGSEQWTVNTYEGVNLFQVAAHEFGHSLGLDHSQIREALMAPFYRQYYPNFKLHEDDIAGIQKLYGPKTGDGPGVYDGQGGNDGPDICKDPQIDTIIKIATGYVYVFKGEYYWRLTTDGIDAGYPILISAGWRGLPSNIDAAFTYNGVTYFFKGSEYWIYSNGRIDENPREIRKDFPGIPDNISAATVRNSDGQIYFFKNDEFWTFNPKQIGGSQPISNLPGVPENVDAVISSPDGVVIFKGDGVYVYDDETFSIVDSDLHMDGSLFGCPSEEY